MFLCKRGTYIYIHSSNTYDTKTMVQQDDLSGSFRDSLRCWTFFRDVAGDCFACDVWVHMCVSLCSYMLFLFFFVRCVLMFMSLVLVCLFKFVFNYS